MKKLSYILIMLCLLLGSLFSRAQSRSDYAKIYQKQSQVINGNLPNPCKFDNDESSEYFEAKSKETDFDETYEQFVEEVRAQGALNVDMFPPPANPTWNYATHAIETILNWGLYFKSLNDESKSEKCFFNAKEIFAFMYYTGEGYRMINIGLRTENPKINAKTRIVLKYLNQALDKLKPFEGYVKRGQYLDVNNAGEVRKFNEEHKEGQIVSFKGYTSTTVGKAFPGAVQYVLKTKKNCFYIKHFSMMEQVGPSGQIAASEEEVLCKPGVKFKVLYHNVTESRHEVLMEEVE